MSQAKDANATRCELVVAKVWGGGGGGVPTCGERGRQRVHLLVHHLLVQRAQAEGLHGERQRARQHGVHVDAAATHATHLVSRFCFCFKPALLLIRFENGA